MLKYYIARSLRIPRRIRKLYYTRYNRLKFWLYGIRFGKNMCVFAKCYIEKAHGSNIEIGYDFRFTNDEAFNPLCRNIRGCLYTAFPNSKINIGNNVGMSSTCVWANTCVTIGNNVKIGGDCLIMDTDAHNLDYHIRRSHKTDKDKYSIDSKSANTAPIIIEDDVLIGTRCIILKGVTIGARSVIAAGSVVTKSVPADCIAGGNPCKIIRMNI